MANNRYRRLIVVLIFIVEFLALYTFIQSKPHITTYGIIGVTFWGIVLSPMIPKIFWHLTDYTIPLKRRIVTALLIIVIPLVIVFLIMAYLTFIPLW